MDAKEYSGSNGSGVLNVLLHGAFTFVRGPNHILALMPSLEHHVFRAGSWLAETELRGGGVEYELKGVTSGSGAFDPGLNLMVIPQPRPDTPQPRSTLIFPIPRKITSLRIADVPRASFTHPQYLEVNSDQQHVSTLQVFTYDFDDENALFLKANQGDGHYWEPAFVRNHINLHIFSAEDHIERPSNSLEDFNQCAELLGVPLRLNTRLVPSGIPAPGRLPDGVAPEETEDLAVRTLRMARLGRLVQQKSDANLAWFGNDALDGDPEGCGGPVG